MGVPFMACDAQYAAFSLFSSDFRLLTSDFRLPTSDIY
jgi:hypothetical protein